MVGLVSTSPWAVTEAHLLQASLQAKGMDVLHRPLSNFSTGTPSISTRKFYHVVCLRFFHTLSPELYYPLIATHGSAVIGKSSQYFRSPLGSLNLVFAFVGCHLGF
jgi:hypothetical protein